MSTSTHTHQHTPTDPNLHVPSMPMPVGEESQVDEEMMVEDVHLPALGLRPREVQSASTAHSSPI